MTEATREVTCSRFGERLPGLAKAPLPGALGQRIYEEISERAWNEWTDQEILVINHYGLNLVHAKHHEFLMSKMKAWLFDGADGVDTSQPPEDRPPGLDD